MRLALTPPARILIVRLSAIGDLIHGLPVAMALRRRFPQAVIGWVVEGRSGDLLVEHEAIDELIRLPRRWLKSPAEVWKLRRRLRNLHFDVAVDLQGLTKSAVAAWLSGAKRRIGFAGPDGREASQWLNNELVLPRSTHIVERNLELLEPLGIRRPQVEFGLPDYRTEAEGTDHYLAAARLLDGYAMINPGAGWPSKLWPYDRFAQVARYLGERHRLRTVVVWAGHVEMEMAERLVDLSAGHAIFAPPTSLKDLAALARRARLFIASDTGPLHMAAAVGAPCVGLYGPMPHERNGPYGGQHIALQNARLEGGSRLRRRASNDTMKAITVDEVCLACDTILARKSAPKPQQVA